MIITDTRDDIIIIDDVITKEECEFVISIYDNAPSSFKNKASLYTNREGLVMVADSRQEIAGAEKILFETVGRGLKAVLKHYAKINEVYTDSSRFELVDDGYEITRYDLGQRCKLHIDGPEPAPDIPKCRVMSTLTHLNTCDAKVHFPAQGRVVAVKQGRMIVFPSTHTHPHMVTPVTDTPRYVNVSWISLILKRYADE